MSDDDHDGYDGDDNDNVRIKNPYYRNNDPDTSVSSGKANESHIEAALPVVWEIFRTSKLDQHIYDVLGESKRRHLFRKDGTDFHKDNIYHAIQAFVERNLLRRVGRRKPDGHRQCQTYLPTTDKKFGELTTDDISLAKPKSFSVKSHVAKEWLEALRRNLPHESYNDSVIQHIIKTLSTITSVTE